MNTSEEYKPVTIEQLIVSVKNNVISVKVLIQAILDVDFFIACDEKELAKKKVILPMCVEIDNEKTVCVFTQKKLAEIYMSSEISVVKLPAKQWLKQHPVNYGLIVNPNLEACIKFSATGIQNILKEFA